MRPLLMQYPHDASLADRSDEWMIGSEILAAPVLTQGGHKSIYLPDDVWYDLATGEKFSGGSFDREVPLDAVPAFVHAGSILPMAPLVQHTRGPAGRSARPPRVTPVATACSPWWKTTVRPPRTSAASSARRRSSWDDAAHTLSWKRTGNYSGKDCFTQMKITLGDTTNKSLPVRPLDESGSVPVR